jgi:hypothetical protein
MYLFRIYHQPIVTKQCWSSVHIINDAPIEFLMNESPKQ